jgi:hypothetical protein
MAILVCFVGISYGNQPAQQNVLNFMKKISGDWIGTFNQSTDQVKAPLKYFQATVTQTGPDSYKTIFIYYKRDLATGSLVNAGTSSMTTTIAADGKATNTMIGEGEVIMEDGTLKWEKHQFTETLDMSSPDTLQGSGKGTVVVSDTPTDENGKKGKILKYASLWSLNDRHLRLILQFQVRFKKFIFGRTYSITMDHEVRRGKDIMDLFKDGDPGNPVQ